MNNVTQLIRMVRWAVLLVWPMTTWAAANTIGSVLGAVTASDWVSVFILTFVSGLVALLHRVRKSLEAAAAAAHGAQASSEDQQLIPWRWFAVCHMTGAMFVGIVTFFVCSSFGVEPYSEAAIISLLSWTGAKLADRAAGALSDSVLARLSSMVGAGKSA